MDTEEREMLPQETTEESPKEAAPDAPVTVEAPAAEAPEKRKMRKGRKTVLIIGCVLSAILTGAVIFGVCYFERLYRLTDHREKGNDAGTIETVVSEEEAPKEEEDEDEAEVSEEETVETIDEESLAESMRVEASEKEASLAAAEEESEKALYKLREDGVTNYLLVGMDATAGNADAIIICSVNYEKKTILLTSIMRDTAVYIDGYGLRKINSACAIAGPELLEEVIEKTFLVDIENYAAVDFNSMKYVIDALGGVDMYITVQEAEFMKIEIEEDRVIHLTGKMALRHSRDRSSGGSDYGRVVRQKNVLLAIIEKARKGGLGDLTKAAEACLPYITHDFSRIEVLTIIMNLPELINFEFLQDRIPYDGLYHNEGEYLVPDSDATVQHLREMIYGE